VNALVIIPYITLITHIVEHVPVFKASECY
jgi:hypothetical protein